jgi:conjugal transfer mating pair stabilization protein TraG
MFMAEQLTAIAHIVTDSYAIKIAGVIGMLSLVFRKLLDGRTQSHILEIGKFFMLAIFVYWGFLTATPGHDVYNIKDKATGYAVQVSGVPAGIGKTISLFSYMELKVAEALEFGFSTPNSTRYSEAGLGFPLSGHYAISKSRPISPYLQPSLDNYTTNCIIPALDEGTMTLNTLLYSQSLKDTIKVNDESRVSVYADETDPTGTVYTCKEAGNKIVAAMQNEYADAVLRANGTLGIVDTTGTGTNVLENKASDIGQLLIGASQSAQDYVMQSTMMNSMDTAFANVAKISGLDPIVLAYGTTKADATAQSNFMMSGQLAHKYLPIMKGVLTLTVVGLAVLLALLSLAYFDTKYLYMIFSLNVWLMLWAPIATIFNHIQMMIVQAAMHSHAAAGGYSLATKGTLDTEVLSALAWMGYVAWLIPLFAYAISKGSDHAFTMMANSLSGALGGATGSAASEAASGNIQLGKMSVGGKEYISPAGSIRQDHMGWTNTSSVDYDGRQYQRQDITSPQGLKSSQMSIGGDSMSMTQGGSVYGSNLFRGATGQNVSAGLSTSLQNAQTSATNAKIAHSKAENALYTQMANDTSSFEKMTTDSEGYSSVKAVNTAKSKAIEYALQNDEQFRDTVAKEMGIGVKGGGQSTVKEIMGAIGGKGGRQKMRRFTMGPDGGVSFKGSDANTISAGESTREGSKAAFQESITASKESKQLTSEGVKSALGNQKQDTYSKSYGDVQSAEKAWGDSKQRVSNLQKAKQMMASIDTDTSNELTDYIMNNWNNGTDSEGKKLSMVEMMDLAQDIKSGTASPADKQRMSDVMEGFIESKSKNVWNKADEDNAEGKSSAGTPVKDLDPDRPDPEKKYGTRQKESHDKVDEAKEKTNESSGIPKPKELNTAEKEYENSYTGKKNALMDEYLSERNGNYEKLEKPKSREDVLMGGAASLAAAGLASSLLDRFTDGKVSEEGDKPKTAGEKIVDQQNKVSDLKQQKESNKKAYDGFMSKSNEKLARSELSSMIDETIGERNLQPGTKEYDMQRQLQESINQGKPLNFNDFKEAGYSKDMLSDMGITFDAMSLEERRELEKFNSQNSSKLGREMASKGLSSYFMNTQPKSEEMAKARESVMEKLQGNGSVSYDDLKKAGVTDKQIESMRMEFDDSVSGKPGAVNFQQTGDAIKSAVSEDYKARASDKLNYEAAGQRIRGEMKDALVSNNQALDSQIALEEKRLGMMVENPGVDFDDPVQRQKVPGAEDVEIGTGKSAEYQAAQKEYLEAVASGDAKKIDAAQDKLGGVMEDLGADKKGIGGHGGKLLFVAGIGMALSAADARAQEGQNPLIVGTQALNGIDPTGVTDMALGVYDTNTNIEQLNTNELKSNNQSVNQWDGRGPLTLQSFNTGGAPYPMTFTQGEQGNLSVNGVQTGVPWNQFAMSNSSQDSRLQLSQAITQGNWNDGNIDVFGQARGPGQLDRLLTANSSSSGEFKGTGGEGKGYASLVGGDRDDK